MIIYAYLVIFITQWMIRFPVDSYGHPQVPLLLFFVVKLLKFVLANIAMWILHIRVCGDTWNFDFLFWLLIPGFPLVLLLVEEILFCLKILNVTKIILLKKRRAHLFPPGLQFLRNSSNQTTSSTTSCWKPCECSSCLCDSA